MLSPYTFQRAQVSSTMGGGGMNALANADEKINLSIQSADKLTNLTHVFEDAIYAKRKALVPGGGAAYSILSSHSVSLLSEKISKSEIWEIPGSKDITSFHMSEKAESGIFLLSPRSRVTRTLEIIPLGSDVKVKVFYSDIEKIVESRVELNISRSYPILDTYMHEMTTDTDTMLASLSRLTSTIILNASQEQRIWERLFTINLDYEDVNDLINSHLSADLVDALTTPMLSIISPMLLSKIRTIGHLYLVAIHARFLMRARTLPRLHHMCLILSLTCQIIRDVKSNISRAAALSPVVTWLMGQTCYDCAIKACSNYISNIRLRLYPTGISEDLKLDRGLAVKIVTIPECGNKSFDIVTAYRSEVVGYVPIATFSNHTLMCIDDMTATSVMYIKESPFYTASFELNAIELGAILLALDYVVNFARSMIRSGSDVGARDWFFKNYIPIDQPSSDLHKLVISLFSMSLKYIGSLSDGCLMLATNLCMRSLLGINVSKIRNLPTSEWMPEIARQVFLHNSSPSFRIPLIAVREVALSIPTFRSMSLLFPDNAIVDYLDMSPNDAASENSYGSPHVYPTHNEIIHADSRPIMSFTANGVTYYHSVPNGGIFTYPPPPV